MRRLHPSPIAREIELMAGREGDDRERPQADVVPEPPSPLDETDAAPLTDACDIKGG